MPILKIISIGSSKGSNPSKGLSAALKYISNPEKTVNGTLVNSAICRRNWKEAYVDMATTKAVYEKKDGVQGYHLVISFSPEEQVTSGKCYAVTKTFVDKYLNNGYEALYAVHTDTDHMHSHIVFNSVSIKDGKKYHCGKSEWRKQMVPALNEQCEKFGLKPLVLDRTSLKKYYLPEDQKPLYQGKRLTREEWEKAKAGHKTWADFAAADIDDAIEDCFSFEEVIRYLQERGWQVKWKTKDGSRELKHFSMRPGKEAYGLEMDHAWIRPGVKCGYGYSKEGIQERLDKCIFHVDEDVEIEAEDEENWKAASIKSKGLVWFENRNPALFTEYQKKRYIMLKRTGQWERMRANMIPRNLRTTVINIKEIEKEVNYMFSHRLDSAEAVRRRKEYLERAKFKYMHPADNEALVKVLDEIDICDRLMQEVKEIPEVEIGRGIRI